MHLNVWNRFQVLIFNMEFPRRPIVMNDMGKDRIVFRLQSFAMEIKSIFWDIHIPMNVSELILLKHYLDDDFWMINIRFVWLLSHWMKENILSNGLYKCIRTWAFEVYKRTFPDYVYLRKMSLNFPYFNSKAWLLCLMLMTLIYQTPKLFSLWELLNLVNSRRNSNIKCKTEIVGWRWFSQIKINVVQSSTPYLPNSFNTRI